MDKKHLSFLTGVILTLVLAGAGCNLSTPTDEQTVNPPDEAPVIQTQSPTPTPATTTDTNKQTKENSEQSAVKVETKNTGTQPMVQIQTKDSQTQPAPAVYEAKVREFTITAKNWEFNPGTIIVNQGDKVRLKITSIDVTHSFMLKDFNINVKLEPNQTQTIEFIADKFGVFQFRCGVPCGEGHRDMVGTLVVK